MLLGNRSNSSHDKLFLCHTDKHTVKYNTSVVDRIKYKMQYYRKALKSYDLDPDSLVQSISRIPNLLLKKSINDSVKLFEYNKLSAYIILHKQPEIPNFPFNFINDVTKMNLPQDLLTTMLLFCTNTCLNVAVFIQSQTNNEPEADSLRYLYQSRPRHQIFVTFVRKWQGIGNVSKTFQNYSPTSPQPTSPKYLPSSGHQNLFALFPSSNILAVPCVASKMNLLIEIDFKIESFCASQAKNKIKL
ncbi:hypothetical protein GQR58_006105 [Nymphon striatum]|nr:hypothetical protein GQR58_006105 [Nymphon striatum]